MELQWKEFSTEFEYSDRKVVIEVGPWTIMVVGNWDTPMA